MKDKLKVLMTTDTVGGVWVYSLELCKALESQGVEIYLAALGAWPSPAQEKAVESLKNVRFYRSPESGSIVFTTRLNPTLST